MPLTKTMLMTPMTSPLDTLKTGLPLLPGYAVASIWKMSYGWRKNLTISFSIARALGDGSTIGDIAEMIPMCVVGFKPRMRPRG